MSKFSLIGILWLVLLAGVEPRGAVASEKPDRQTQEAIALFRSILKHEPGQMGPCALADHWHDPIPEELARRHLGMKLHAGPVAPFKMTTPAQIIDPEGVIRQAFCSEDEAARQREARVEDFRTGVLNIKKGPYDLFSRLTSTIREYSFPVFDRSYRRAVVVATYTSLSWLKDSDGEVEPLASLYARGEAVVYAKHGRLWQSVAREELFIAD